MLIRAFKWSIILRAVLMWHLWEDQVVVEMITWQGNKRKFMMTDARYVVWNLLGPSMIITLLVLCQSLHYAVCGVNVGSLGGLSGGGEQLLGISNIPLASIHRLQMFQLIEDVKTYDKKKIIKILRCYHRTFNM